MFGAVSPRAFCRRTRLPTVWIARAFPLVVDALTRAFVVAVEQARNRSPKREASAFSAAGLMRKAPNALFDERQEKFVRPLSASFRPPSACRRHRRFSRHRL